MEDPGRGLVVLLRRPPAAVCRVIILKPSGSSLGVLRASVCGEFYC